MRKCTLPLLLGILLSLAWPIGSQALNMPGTIRALALSGTGIAGTMDADVNPAALLAETGSHIDFSHNNWLSEFSGFRAGVTWNRRLPMRLSLQTWDLDNIELRDWVPSVDPDGTFGAHWVSGRFSTAMKMFGGSVGVSMQGGLAKIYTETSTLFSLDAGFQKPLGEQFAFGAVIRNLGSSSGDLSLSLPLVIGGGVRYTLPRWQTRLLSDINWDADHGMIFNGAVTRDWQQFTIMAGSLISGDQTRFSLGFNFRYRRFGFGYALGVHENSSLGIPQFLDITVYL